MVRQDVNEKAITVHDASMGGLVFGEDVCDALARLGDEGDAYADEWGIYADDGPTVVSRVHLDGMSGHELAFDIAFDRDMGIVRFRPMRPDGKYPASEEVLSIGLDDSGPTPLDAYLRDRERVAEWARERCAAHSEIAEADPFVSAGTSALIPLDDKSHPSLRDYAIVVEGLDDGGWATTVCHERDGALLPVDDGVFVMGPEDRGDQEGMMRRLAGLGNRAARKGAWTRDLVEVMGSPAREFPRDGESPSGFSIGAMMMRFKDDGGAVAYVRPGFMGRAFEDMAAGMGRGGRDHLAIELTRDEVARFARLVNDEVEAGTPLTGPDIAQFFLATRTDVTAHAVRTGELPRGMRLMSHDDVAREVANDGVLRNDCMFVCSDTMRAVADAGDGRLAETIPYRHAIDDASVMYSPFFQLVEYLGDKGRALEIRGLNESFDRDVASAMARSYIAGRGDISLEDLQEAFVGQSVSKAGVEDDVSYDDEYEDAMPDDPENPGAVQFDPHRHVDDQDMDVTQVPQGFDDYEFEPEPDATDEEWQASAYEPDGADVGPDDHGSDDVMPDDVTDVPVGDIGDIGDVGDVADGFGGDADVADGFGGFDDVAWEEPAYEEGSDDFDDVAWEEPVEEERPRGKSFVASALERFADMAMHPGETIRTVRSVVDDVRDKAGRFADATSESMRRGGLMGVAKDVARDVSNRAPSVMRAMASMADMFSRAVERGAKTLSEVLNHAADRMEGRNAERGDAGREREARGRVDADRGSETHADETYDADAIGFDDLPDIPINVPDDGTMADQAGNAFSAGAADEELFPDDMFAHEEDDGRRGGAFEPLDSVDMHDDVEAELYDADTPSDVEAELYDADTLPDVEAELYDADMPLADDGFDSWTSDVYGPPDEGVSETQGWRRLPSTYIEEDTVPFEEYGF